MRLWNKTARQTGFFVGSVCFRNLTCLYLGQWCVKRRVMLSKWGIANFVSSVSITPVKRLTSVNSVYSVNNFCSVCDVNLLYNIWIWKVPLIRRCPFQKAKYSCKVVSVLGFPINKESTVSSVLCMTVEGIGQIWKVLEGLSVLRRRLIRRSNDRTGNARGQVPQKFADFEQSCQEEVHI